MSVHCLPDGRWICTIPKGTLPGQDKQTKEYFGRGTEGERKARARNLELGIGVPVARRVTSMSFSEHPASSVYPVISDACCAESEKKKLPAAYIES